MARLVVAATAGTLVVLAWAGLALAVRRAGWPGWPRPRWEPAARAGLTPLGATAALAAAVLVPVVSLAVFNSSSGFVWDDIKNLRQAQVDGLSFSYLMEPTSGHFAPGHRLGDWLQFRLFGFEFVPAQVQLLAGFALSLVLFHRILVDLFRPGLGATLVTLGFGLSMVHVGVTQWWASGLDRVPATVLSFLAVWTYVRWHRARAWPYLAVSVAAIAFGLLFYIKPAFVPVYLGLITLLLLDPDRPVGESLRAALADWWVWLTFAVVTGALALVYVSRYPVELNRDGGVDVALRYLGILWSRVFVPNLFGLFVPKGDMSPAMVAAAVAAQALLVAVVAVTIVRRPGAWRAWAFFAAAYLLNAVVVGLTRVSESTTEVLAYTTYFNLEAVFAFFLALAAALLGSPAEGQERSPAPSAAPVVVGVGVVAYAAMSLWGGWQVSRPEHWIGARSRMVLDRAEADLARLHRAGVDVALVDGVFPVDVVPYLLVPYNSASEVVPLFDGAASFDAGAGELFSIGRRGRVRPVEFVAEAGGGADALAATDRFGIVGAVATRREPDRICLDAGRDTVTVGLQPPERLDDGDGPLALTLEFESARPSVLSLVVLPVPVNTEPLAGGRDRFRVVNIPGGERQRRVYALDAPEAETVLVVVAPDTELCVYRMEAGHLAPR